MQIKFLQPPFSRTVFQFLPPHTDPESNRLVQKVQKSKSLYRKIALITFVEDFLEHKKLIFFIA